MNRLVAPAALAFVFVVSGAGATPAADIASPIVGVWKLQRFDRCVVGGTCAASYGEQPVGYAIYTKSGLFMSQGYGAGRIVSKTPDPTDAERIELFKTMYAWGGPYMVEGNGVTTKIEFAWTEGWKGQTRNAKFNVDGRTLTLESSHFKSPIDGSLIFTRLVLERVE
jgi:hypothetical protein